MCLNAAKIISVSIFLAAGRKLVKNLKYTKKGLGRRAMAAGIMYRNCGKV